MRLETESEMSWLFEPKKPWIKYDKDDTSNNNNNNNNDKNKKMNESESIFVCNESEFKNKSRLSFIFDYKDPNDNNKIKKRPIVIFKVKKKYYGMDKRCYHAGGDLSMGDIEEIDKKLCVLCPWHNYIITLETGDGLYIGYDAKKKQNTGVKSKGKRQRIHNVFCKDKKIYIQLNYDIKELASDQYARIMNDKDEGPKGISFKGK